MWRLQTPSARKIEGDRPGIRRAIIISLRPSRNHANIHELFLLTKDVGTPSTVRLRLSIATIVSIRAACVGTSPWSCPSAFHDRHP